MSPKEQAEQIYQAYPKKVGKPVAIKSIIKALSSIEFEKLLELTQKYAAIRKSEDANFTPHPSTWFNQERFGDDPSTWGRQASKVIVNNPRNAGIIVGPTNYATAKPRYQREQEEKARLAQQVDQAQSASLPAEGGHREHL